MSDLISRQAAIDAVTAWLNKAINPNNRSKYNDGEIAAYETALSELKKIPSAQPPVDAVPVVRCEDCKHLAHSWVSSDTNNNMIFHCNSLNQFVADDFFCADGTSTLASEEIKARK